MSAARPSGIDLVAAATEDFRANLRHPRAQALLIDYYVKQGMTSEELRQAMRAAAAPRHAPIRVQIPDTVAARRRGGRALTAREVQRSHSSHE